MPPNFLGLFLRCILESLYQTDASFTIFLPGAKRRLQLVYTRNFAEKFRCNDMILCNEAQNASVYVLCPAVRPRLTKKVGERLSFSGLFIANDVDSLLLCDRNVRFEVA